MNFIITNDKVIGAAYWQEGMPESVRQKDEEAARKAYALLRGARSPTMAIAAAGTSAGRVEGSTSAER